MRTLVILVNRNNKNDTIECLESLRRCEGDFDVWVSDNASSDGSIAAFEEWASGRGTFRGGALWKKIEAQPLLRGAVTWRSFSTEKNATEDQSDRWVSFVSTGGSKGFAAGNNIGLRYGLTRPYEYFWILNNDTVVDPKALTELLTRMRQDRTIGACGSTVVFYSAPTTIQCLGGSIYNIDRADSTAVGWGRRFPDGVVDYDQIEPVLDYVYGASMLVTRRFVLDVGLMNEDLYLYFDEMDWAIRMKGKFRNGFAPQSVVFHKHGGTVGQGDYKKPSRESVRFMTINQILFTRQHYSTRVARVVANVCLNIVKNVAKGKFQVALWTLQDLIYALRSARYPLGYLADQVS